MIVMDKALQEVLGYDKITLAQAAWEMFQVLQHHRSSMLSLFQVLFTEQVEFPNSPIRLGELISPPGGEYLFAIIQRETGVKNPNAIMWGVNAISSHVLHGAIMLCSAFGQQKLANQPFFKPDFKRRSLAILANAVITQVKASNIKWPICYRGDLG
jgi:hypothetical protein